MAWRWGIAFFMVTWVYLIVKGDMEMYNSSEIFEFQSVPGIFVEMMCEIHVRPEAVCIGCNKTALWWAVVRGIIGEGMKDN